VFGIRSRPAGFSATLTLCVVALVGCGEPEAEPRLSLSCADVRLEQDRGVPLDPVAIRGSAALPAGELRIAVADDTGAGGPVMWRRDETGTAVVTVPLHPSGRLEGGTVRLSVEAFGTVCDLGTLVIEPLQRAPGTAVRVLDGLQAYVAAQAWHFGATPAELKVASPDTLLPPLVPLYVAQAVLDHPENPNSIRSVLEGGAPYFAGGEADLSLLDALYGRAAVDGGLAGLIRSVGQTGEPPAGSGSASMRPQPHSAFQLASLVIEPPLAERRSQDAQDLGYTFHQCPMPDNWYKPNASELSCWMHLAMNGDIMTSGKAKDLYDAFSLTLGVGSTLPVPIYREGMVIAGAYAFAYQKAAEASANLLPRTLDSISVLLNPDVYMEDDARQGSYAPINVFAGSRGWNTATSVVEALLQVFGLKQMKGGMGSLTKAWDEAASALPDQWVADYGSFVMQTLFEKEILPNAPGAAEGQDNPFQIAPHKYGPTDVTARQWSEVKIEGSAVQLVGPPRYEPKQIGTATLIAWTKPLKFGDQQIRGEYPLEVKPLRVTISPAEKVVEPGEKVLLTASVENALDTDLKWTVSKGHSLEPGADQLTATVTTSTTPEHFPAIVLAKSKANRDHLNFKSKAFGSASVRISRIRLEPAFACVEPGKRQEFVVHYPVIAGDGFDVPDPASGYSEVVPAATRGGPDPSAGVDFVWEPSSGFVSRRGVFKAPDDGSGTIVEIRATHRNDPRLTATARARIGGCQCWSFISIGRPVVRTVSGYASFMRSDKDNLRDLTMAGGLQVSLTNANALEIASGGDPMEMATRQIQFGFSYPGFVAKETGEFPLSLAVVTAGSVAGGEAYMLAFEPGAYGYGQGGGVVRITTHTPTVLAGSIDANLMLAGRRDYIAVPVQARFRAVTGSLTDNSSDLWKCMKPPGM